MLERFEILDKLAPVFLIQPQSEMFVVMIDHIRQCLEATVMVEAALLMRPKARQWRRTIHVRRRAVCLESVNSHFGGRLQVVPRFREQRRDVADRALCLAVEDRSPTRGGICIKAICWRSWCRDRKLIEVQRRKL
jgi:hypothetical protein